jgi:hypothetical protein
MKERLTTLWVSTACYKNSYIFTKWLSDWGEGPTFVSV